jgi:hypothetical protein
MQMARDLTQLRIATVDQRTALERALDRHWEFRGGVTRYDDAPHRFLFSDNAAGEYDVIVVPAAAPESYQAARFLGVEFLSLARRGLRPGGLLVLITPYDTDRYVTDRQAAILSPVVAGLTSTFRNVWFWPGTSTLLMASDSLQSTPVDSLAGRLRQLPYEPQYLIEETLQDRLQPYKIDRLRDALATADAANSIDRPQLVRRQQLLQAAADGSLSIVGALIDNPVWPTVLACAVLISLALVALAPGDRYRRFSLVLLLVSGWVSLSLELLSFYLYQSVAGSLHSHLAVLIGSFMLGLALGTVQAQRQSDKRLEYPSLVILLAASLMLWLTYDHVAVPLLLLYHSLFLLVAAMATGSLFVAASARYYESPNVWNRGLTYAAEILGAALGALLTMAVLLPLIGVRGLLGAICLLLILTFAGAAATERY